MYVRMLISKLSQCKYVFTYIGVYVKWLCVYGTLKYAKYNFISSTTYICHNTYITGVQVHLESVQNHFGEFDWVLLQKYIVGWWPVFETVFATSKP